LVASKGEQSEPRKASKAKSQTKASKQGKAKARKQKSKQANLQTSKEKFYHEFTNANLYNK